MFSIILYENGFILITQVSNINSRLNQSFTIFFLHNYHYSELQGLISLLPFHFDINF